MHGADYNNTEIHSINSNTCMFTDVFIYTHLSDRMFELISIAQQVCFRMLLISLKVEFAIQVVLLCLSICCFKSAIDPCTVYLGFD